MKTILIELPRYKYILNYFFSYSGNVEITFFDGFKKVLSKNSLKSDTEVSIKKIKFNITMQEVSIQQVIKNLDFVD